MPSSEAPTQSARPFSVLLFTKTVPGCYRHASIPAAVAALERLAARRGDFTFVATEADDAITPLALARHATVIFLHNIDTFLDAAQLEALRGYIRAGGGFVGVHSASAAMLEDEWYGRLIGAHFDMHPEAQWGAVRVQDPRHYITAEESGVEDQKVIKWHDEWYNFKSDPRAANVNVLLSVEESSYEGGTHGEGHPIAWCHEFEGARVFYTSLGHFDEAYEDEWFMGQLERAIFWTAKKIE